MVTSPSPSVAADRSLPEGWWGPVWNRPRIRSLPELVAGQLLNARMAAALWSLVEQGRSLLIAARCGGAGKSTLVTSLLDAVPPERPRCFARGVHQDQGELSRLKTGSAILVNEISPHMPIYCW